jgi:hypothetical protein
MIKLLKDIFLLGESYPMEFLNINTTYSKRTGVQSNQNKDLVNNSSCVEDNQCAFMDMSG